MCQQVQQSSAKEEDSSLVIFTYLALDRVDLLQEQWTQVFTKWIKARQHEGVVGGKRGSLRQKKLSNWSWAQHSKEKDTLPHVATVKVLRPEVQTQTYHHTIVVILYTLISVHSEHIVFARNYY